MDIHPNLGTEGSSLPLPVLRLLVPPLQLLSAAMWQVAEKGDIKDYGTLAEIVTSVTETAPELLNVRQKAQLILGLSAKMVLELCRSEDTAELQIIQPHLDRIRAATRALEGPDSCVAEVSEYNFPALVHNLLRDPVAREHFFQVIRACSHVLQGGHTGQIEALEEVFPVEYGPKFDSALRGLIWEFLSRLGQLLPVPDLKQTASWLSAAPSILDECVESVYHSRHLKALLKIHRNRGHLNPNGTPSSSTGNCIFSSLSLPPLVGAAARRTDTEIQSEFLNDPVMYEEDMETESVVVTEYAEVELGTSMCTSEGRTSGVENTPEPQWQMHNESEVDHKGIHIEHLEGELELMCEVDQINGDGVELVSEKSSLMNNEVVDVLSEKMGAAPACEELETMDGEVEIGCEEMELMDDVKNKCQEWVISVDDTHDSQASFGEGIHEEREVKEEEAERTKRVHARHMDTDKGNASDSTVSCQLSLPRILLHRHDISGLPFPMSSSSSQRNKMLLRSKGRSQKSIEGQVVLKNEANVTWVVPLKRLPVASEEGEDTECCSAAPVNSAANLTKDEMLEASPLVFGCHQCSSNHTKEMDLQQHIQNLHPAEDDKHQDSGDNGSEPAPPEPSSSKSRKKSHSNIPHTLRKYSKRTPCSKTCPVCGKTFTRATDMRRHQRSHTGERPYKCTQCEKSFLYSFDLKRHQRRRTGLSPFQCCVCGNGFDQEEGLMTHRGIAHPAGVTTTSDDTGSRLILTAEVKMGEGGCEKKSQHKCHQCDMTFGQTSQMKRHQQIHSEDDPLRCNQCWKKCPNPDALSRHMQMHSIGQQFQCTACKINFSQFICLRQHYLMNHKEEGSFLCSHCPKGFSKLSNLIKHQRTHTGERPYQCSHCPKRFTQLQILTRHERIHTGERPFLCSDCGKSFLSSGELSKHLQSHSEARPFPCSQCDKTFKANRFLKKHLKIHTGERPFPCSYCGKRFAKSTDLTRHNRMHTGERPHTCSQCGKSFLTYAEVVKHLRYHTGERPFKCAQCGKTFTQSCYLTVHMRIHTGERPYHCTVCGKSFNSTTPLRRHMLTHTGEKPFKCSDCGKAYNRSHLLREHEKIHAAN